MDLNDVKFNYKELLDLIDAYSNDGPTIKDIVEHSKNRYSSPSKYLQDQSYLNHLAISNSILNKDDIVAYKKLQEYYK